MWKLDNINIHTYQEARYIVHNHGGYCYNREGRFIKHSNDWAYLINGVCNPPVIGAENTTIDEDVIPIISGFHTGVHAYVGIFSILSNYFKNKDQLKGKKLLVYRNVQKGIHQAIDYLIETNHIERSDIIYLDPDTLYLFKTVTLIPNSLHSYWEDSEIRDEIVNFIDDKLTKKQPSPFDKISILKHHNSGVSSDMGAIDYELAKSISREGGYKLIEPSEVGEIEVINLLKNAKEVLFSWGTTFMKNYIYISNRCKKIDVLITGNPFMLEFDNAVERGILPTSFKKANIGYHYE
jgi:hypothetical protein